MLLNENQQNIGQFDNILSLDPDDLLIWLQNNYSEDIPTSITSVDDLKHAGEMLGKLTNIYSYLVSLSLFAKLRVRENKKNKVEKEEVDKSVDRKEIITTFAENIKMQYTAISRMITVKKQIDDEMRMI